MRKTLIMDDDFYNRLQAFAKEQGTTTSELLRSSAKFVMDEVSRGYEVVVSSEQVYK